MSEANTRGLQRKSGVAQLIHWSCTGGVDPSHRTSAQSAAPGPHRMRRSSRDFQASYSVSSSFSSSVSMSPISFGPCDHGRPGAHPPLARPVLSIQTRTTPPTGACIPFSTESTRAISVARPSRDVRRR